MPGFVRQALTGLPLTGCGEGRQTRSFVYVADGVEDTVRAMLRPGRDGEVLDLDDPLADGERSEAVEPHFFAFCERV